MQSGVLPHVQYLTLLSVCLWDREQLTEGGVANTRRKCGQEHVTIAER